MNPTEKTLVTSYIDETWSREEINKLVESALNYIKSIEWIDPKPSIRQLFRLICEIRGQNPRDVRKKRQRPYALTRQIFVYLAIKIHAPEFYRDFPMKKLPSEVTQPIQVTIKRHHATVYKNFRTVTNLKAVDNDVAAQLAYIEQQIIKRIEETAKTATNEIY